MKRRYLIFVLSLFLLACQENTQHMETEIKEESAHIDTTPRVTGVGGVFFRSENPDSLTNWYKENLGMKTDPYGGVFEFRNANDPDEINYLRWSAFPVETDYFSPSEKDFMINYRVRNIEGLVRNFKKNGVQVVDEIQAYDYGKFVHLLDPDGNKIELWEPVDSVLSEMGGETNK